MITCQDREENTCNSQNVHLYIHVHVYVCQYYEGNSQNVFYMYMYRYCREVTVISKGIVDIGLEEEKKRRRENELFDSAYKTALESNQQKSVHLVQEYEIEKTKVISCSQYTCTKKHLMLHINVYVCVCVLQFMLIQNKITITFQPVKTIKMKLSVIYCCIHHHLIYMCVFNNYYYLLVI